MLKNFVAHRFESVLHGPHCLGAREMWIEFSRDSKWGSRGWTHFLKSASLIFGFLEDPLLFKLLDYSSVVVNWLNEKIFLIEMGIYLI